MAAIGSAQVLWAQLAVHPLTVPIVLLPHVRADADAIGSGLGLLRLLRGLGFEAHLLLEEEAPLSLQVLEDLPLAELDEGRTLSPARAFLLDCHEASRLGRRARYVEQSQGIPLILDHHVSRLKEAEATWIDSSYASTGELLTELLMARDLEDRTAALSNLPHFTPDRAWAEDVLAAIYADTGSLAFSQVGARTFRDLAWLMRFEPRLPEIHDALFSRRREAQLRLRAHCYLGLEKWADGRVVAATVTREMMRAESAIEDDLEGLVAELRMLEGCELAILARELPGGRLRLNLRTKRQYNAQSLASAFGGGGHVKAAGCEIHKGDWERFILAALAALPEETI